MSRRKLIELGSRFSRLVVVGGPSPRIEGRGDAYPCECDCSPGVTKLVCGSQLRRGIVSSCGCLRKERAREAAFRHGHRRSTGRSNSPTYDSWMSMRQRCENPRCSAFKYYGARGIRVCRRWKKFENFLADMGERTAGTTIERKNNERGYSPGNCVWAVERVQARNRRNNHYVNYLGKRICIAELAERIGVRAGTLVARITNYGWSVERAISTPIGPSHRTGSAA